MIHVSNLLFYIISTFLNLVHDLPHCYYLKLKNQNLIIMSSSEIVQILDV